jgi:hypothetical protein
VANEMLALSKNFIYELSTWINMKYTDTLARTTLTLKEVWALIAHCVRVVFKLLRDAQSSAWITVDPRSPGRRRTAGLGTIAMSMNDE